MPNAMTPVDFEMCASLESRRSSRNESCLVVCQGGLMGPDIHDEF